MDAFTLITGASSGLGRGIAERLAGEGPLLLSGRDTGRLEAVRHALPDPDRHRVWACDLARPDRVFDEATAFVQDQGLPVARFVHAAGLSRLAPARLLGPGETDTQFQVNFFSLVELFRALTHKKSNARHLEAVVILSSIAAKKGTPGFSMYAASKAAQLGWMRAIAVEFAPRLRVNAVLPGGVRTPGTESFYQAGGEAERIAAAYPLGAGEAADIAAMTAFLLSTQARWITGQELVVDGGISLL